MEIGVGSGAVVVALARELAQLGWVAVDISVPALEVARDNARRQGVLERVHFLRGDLFSGLKPDPRFALVVANLPYVSEEEWEALPREIREYEPREALWGGADGLALLRPLAQQAHEYLRPGGWLALEVGLGQAGAVRQILQDTGAYDRLEIIPDYGGIERVVRARKESAN
ncbi:MAG: HemK/PrmC family methyltransferase [Thermodesulfobacteriota bacterium]